jgi:hypothetical protein
VQPKEKHIMATETVSAATDLLARNADGTLADMPRDLAHTISCRLGTVLALLDAIADKCPLSSDEADEGEYHDDASRLAALVNLSHREVRDVIREMDAYV